jgi:hypothetical protein
MDASLEDIKRKVILVLADEAQEVDYGESLGGGTYPAELLKDAVCAALDAITVRIWKSATEEIEGEVTEYETPEDLLSVEGILDVTSGTFLPQVNLMANKHRLIGIETNAWMDYPEGTITFVDEIGASGAILYYSAYWSKPEDDDDSLEPPEGTITAIVMYAASYCLLNQASGSANIRQFATKIDAGAPTDIPAKDMADFFLRRFEIELQRLPARQKGILQ